jgi:hypothetical protein
MVRRCLGEVAGFWRQKRRSMHLRWKYGCGVPMSKMLCAVLLAALICLMGCRGSRQRGAHAQTGGPPATKPAPPTPIAVKKAELGDDSSWDPQWDKIVEEALPADLLSPEREHAVRSLCPSFNQMSETDRRAFWAYFFQALAGAEAGLKPTADVRHSEPEVAVIDPVTHRVARQEGLLQLAYTDGQRYGCNFDWDRDKELPEHDPEKTILQPQNNLECGIRILDDQLMVKHKPLLSESSYWVTLRPGTTSFRVFAKQLANLPSACGASPYRLKSIPGAVTAPASEAKNQPRNHDPVATRADANAH